MARYIPSDETGRRISKEWLADRLRAEFGQTEYARQKFHVIVDAMAEDGTCQVTLQANPDDFNFRTYLDDVDVIEGQAWIDGVDGFDPKMEYQFGSGLDLGEFLTRHAQS